MKKKEIYFRSSSFGNLMTESSKVLITEIQLAKLNEFEQRISANLKPLTDNQRKEYVSLIEKKNAPPQLSETAKKEVEKIWRLNEKGYYEDLDNKYLTKGLFNENDGVYLVAKKYGEFCEKNDVRISKNNITGEADLILNLEGKKVIIDIKCSWDSKTFMNGELSKIYEYQLRCYMYLYDADEAYLCYCLTDTPSHFVANAKKQQWYKYVYDGMTNEEANLMEEKLQKIYEQIDRNMVYSTNPAYSEEEMVKTYKIVRDKEIEANMLSKIPLAISYYNSIKLNQL